MSYLTTSAKGKIILAGEYAVLFGHQAIVSAIDKKAICTFWPGPSVEFFTNTLSTPIQQNEHPLFISGVKSCYDEGFTISKGKYLIDTCEFYNPVNQQKLGLGSSAAAITALCKMIMAQHEVYDTNKLFTIAKKAHHDFSNGLGSGVDVAASVFGGTISYTLDKNDYKINILNLNPPWQNIFFIDTKRAQDTKPFIKNVLELKKVNPDFIANFCEESSLLCKELMNTNGNIGTWINIFEQLFFLLNELGCRAHIDIISKEHEEIYNIAKTYSGSAKPSGAGGGDISLAIVPTKHKAQFIDKIIRRGLSLEAI